MNVTNITKMCRLVASALPGMAASLPAHADWWQDFAAERQQFCQGIEAGGGRVAACIDQHERELSAGCRER